MATSFALLLLLGLAGQGALAANVGLASTHRALRAAFAPPPRAESQSARPGTEDTEPRAPQAPPRAPRPPNPTLAGSAALLSGGGCPDVQAVFDTTNMYRAWHGAPRMEWDSKLAAAAASYAAKLVDEGCGLEHSNEATSGKVGENLWSLVGFPKPDGTCKPAIDTWYREFGRFNWNAPKLFRDNWPAGVGHFTALVWKSTERFGCGTAYKSRPMGNSGLVGACKVVVCRYLEPGNLASDEQFEANVLPLRSAAQMGGGDDGSQRKSGGADKAAASALTVVESVNR